MTQIEAALGAKFEILFGKKHPDVIFFFLFCNLVNILHADPAAAATKAKIQIMGFLQWGKATAVAASKNGCASPCRLFFPENGSVVKAACLESRSTKLAGLRIVRGCQSRVQTGGEFGKSNKGRAANKSPQTAVIASSDVLSFVFPLN